ncbi:MAG: isoprenylcysteine carboxylmethyltransferase family protein [Paludibacteraceae bacterium]|nr:isoprenylcysteine carboxylmethyltransferase family protein [Paludibacteraceae bacterium]
MTPKLFIQAFTKFIVGLLLVGLLLFLPAGTFAFWQAWLFIGILFIPMFIAGIWLMWKQPELLRKRLSAQEEQTEQKWVVALSSLLFIAMFVVAGLNFRFGWVLMPNWTTYVAAGIFLFGYVLYAEVMRENVWLSRTVEVQQNQKVIDTGLYGIVRHPMYTATLLLFLSIPLVLNSVWSFALMLLYIPIIVKRIHNEEIVLERDLTGYKEYKQRVRFRLIPYIW